MELFCIQLLCQLPYLHLHDINYISKIYKSFLYSDFKQVDEIYVRKLLHNINAQKATGYDNIPPKMVKMYVDELSVTLTELMNYAFSNKIFPDDIKKAEISPIFKKKDDLATDNYRPISILVVFSKVFETIIAEQLMEYFTSIFDNMYMHIITNTTQSMY